MRGEEEGWRKSLYLQKSIMEISNDFEKVFKRAQAPAVDALSLNNPPTLSPPHLTHPWHKQDLNTTSAGSSKAQGSFTDFLLGRAPSQAGPGACFALSTGSS